MPSKPMALKRPLMAITLAVLLLAGCKTSSRENYDGEFDRELGTVGLTLGTAKALAAGDTNKAYHWNLIFLNESMARAEMLARKGPPERRQMLFSLSKVVLSHLEKSKEQASRTWQTDSLALEITTVLSRVLSEKEDRRRLQELQNFFESKFVEERKSKAEFDKQYSP